MRRTQQLLSRAIRQQGQYRTTFSGIRAYSKRPSSWDTYDVSRSVLEIDETNDRRVKPAPRGGLNGVVDLVQTLIETPQGIEQLFRTTEQVAAQIRELTVREGKWRTAHVEAMSALNEVVDMLDAHDIVMGPALCAEGLRLYASRNRGPTVIHSRRIAEHSGRYFNEMKTKGYSLKIKTTGEHGMYMTTAGKSYPITTHPMEMATLLTPPPRKPDGSDAPKVQYACLRDFITTQDEYDTYLGYLFTIKDNAQKAIMEEWTKEQEKGYLSKPSFDTAMVFMDIWLARSLLRALQVVKRWSEAHGKSPSDFLSLVNEPGVLEKLANKTQWARPPTIFRAGINAFLNHPDLDALAEELKSLESSGQDRLPVTELEREIRAGNTDAMRNAAGHTGPKYQR